MAGQHVLTLLSNRQPERVPEPSRTLVRDSRRRRDAETRASPLTSDLSRPAAMRRRSVLNAPIDLSAASMDACRRRFAFHRPR